VAGFSDFIRSIIPWTKSLVGGGLFGGGGKKATVQPQQPPPPPAIPINEDFLHSGSWLHLASSNVEAIRYLWDAEILECEFKGSDRHGEGYLYQYFNVPANVIAIVEAAPGAEGLVITAGPQREG
jgi:KTSC domain